ncbi:MAG: methyltransferase domain-containing protein, partial [Candidatus Omnitrophota bacterium]
MRDPRCNLCGTSNCDVAYRHKPGGGKVLPRDSYAISESEMQKPEVIYRCRTCGLVFARQDYDIAQYERKYVDMVDGGYLTEEEGRRDAAIRVIRRIERYKKKGRILDIGCASGFLLDEARRRNWETFGVEMSKWAAEYAANRLNLNVFQGALKEAVFPDKHFDAVVMLDVIEHLSDPHAMLGEIRRILKNDGVLYISTPDIMSFMSRVLGGKWWGINKFHLFYFSKVTLRRLLDVCGFKVLRYNPHIRIFSVNYWVERLRPYSNFIYNMLDFISRIGSLGKVKLSVNFRDQIEVLAVKAKKPEFADDAPAGGEYASAGVPMKTIAVLPAHNAAKTLKITVDGIPKNVVSEIILVDDKST